MSVLRALRWMRELLTPDDRRELARIVPAMVVSSMMDLVVVVAIGGFFGALARPQVLTSNATLRSLRDASGASSDAQFLALVGVGVFGVVLCGNAFSAWTMRRVLAFAWRQVQSIGERTLASYLNRPYEFFLVRKTPELTQRVLVEVHSIVDKVVVQLAQAVARSFGALLVLGWLFWTDPVLSLLLVAVLGSGYSTLLFVLRNVLFRLGRERTLAGALRNQLAHESLVGVKEIKLLGLEDEITRRFRVPSAAFAAAMTGQATASQVPRYALESVAVGGMVVVVVVLLARGDPLEGAVALLGTYAIAAYRLLPTAQALFATASHLRFELHSLEQIHRDVTTAPALARPTPTPVAFDRTIELAGLGFRYPGTERLLFDGFDLVVPKGRWVALVGTTGSGKSTLVDLLMGLLVPSAGELRVDGRALATPEERLGWQARIGYVPQSIFVSDDTIARNVAFGHDAPDPARLARAARIAALDAFVERELEQGWDTPAGERGLRLSGGQRQRVGLARAVYREPDVLVLDEATSALDNETEARVMERLSEHCRGTTVILVAHRLTTTRYCDEILLLDGGRILDRAPYDVLLARSERFRELVAASEREPRA